MKRLIFFLLASTSAHAQLAPGSMAPDFTVRAYQPALGTSGMNGDASYTLYDYLDAGYTVYVELTSTLCMPCWNFHQAGVLEELYEQHGPLLPGHPGVAASSTDDIMVVWIDAQASTPDSWMENGSPIVQGNWINPDGTGEVPFPMCNPESAVADQLMDDYMVPFYPTIYRICPNRTAEAVWSYDPDEIYAAASACPQASGTYNPSLLSWRESGMCPLVECVVTLQNMGHDDLTAADIVFRKDADVIQTISWTGNLATFQTAGVYLGTLDPQQEEVYTAEIVTPDDDGSDNVLNEPIGPTPVAAGFTVDIEITTDAFGNETRWELQNLTTGTIVAQHGAYALVQPPATVVQPVIEVTLEGGECYVFTIFDGDGMNNGVGNGGYVLRDEAGNTVVSGGTFTGYDKKRFIVGGTAGVKEESAWALEVYPNPASEQVYVKLPGKGAYELTVTDLTGRQVRSFAIGSVAGQPGDLQINGLVSGNYLLTATKEGTSVTQRLIVH